MQQNEGYIYECRVHVPVWTTGTAVWHSGAIPAIVVLAAERYLGRRRKAAGEGVSEDGRPHPP